MLDARFSAKGTNYSSTLQMLCHIADECHSNHGKQIRNYGYTRMVANKDTGILLVSYCDWVLPSSSHFSVIAVIYGMLSGGAADEYWLTLSVEVDNTPYRISWHGQSNAVISHCVGLAQQLELHHIEILLLCFLAPLFVFLAQWAYGQV